MSKTVIKETMIQALTLMRATARYIHPRINGKSRREAYRAAAAQCIAILSHATTDMQLNILEYVETNLLRIETDYLPYMKPSLFNDCSLDIESYKMAVSQAREIVCKLNARFITGACDSEPRIYKGKGLLVYSDKDIA